MTARCRVPRAWCGVRTGAWCLVGAWCLALTAGCGWPSAQGAAAPTPHALAALWDAERVSAPVSALVDHREVVDRLRALQLRDPGLVLEEIGQSVEKRAIYHLAVGRGPFHVLLWSQMHGDEPTATSALFDLLGTCGAIARRIRRGAFSTR